MVAGQIARQSRSLGRRLDRGRISFSIILFPALLIVCFPFYWFLIRELFTLPVKLMAISQQLNTPWDVSMPASTVLTIPIIPPFPARGRLLEQGLAAGGVEG